MARLVYRIARLRKNPFCIFDSDFTSFACPWGKPSDLSGNPSSFDGLWKRDGAWVWLSLSQLQMPKVV